MLRQNPLKSQEQRCQPSYSQKLHESQILNKSSSFCWFNTTLLPPGITKLLLMSGATTKISLWHLSPRKNLLWSSTVFRIYLYNEALPCDQRWIIRGNNTVDWSEENYLYQYMCDNLNFYALELQLLESQFFIQKRKRIHQSWLMTLPQVHYYLAKPTSHKPRQWIGSRGIKCAQALRRIHTYRYMVSR